MEHTVLVLGGTGMLGEPVARRLALDGRPVRVMTRDPARAAPRLAEGIEAVRGDVDDAASLEAAMEGCTGVHLSLDGAGDWDVERRAAAAVSALASGAGIERITIITGASTAEENAWFPMTRAKLDAEEAIRASGVPFTIFRCTMFMELLPTLVRGRRALVMGRQPTPWHWVAATDYAAMVSRAYTTPEAAGKTLFVRGPEPWTFEEAVETYRAACAPDARLVHMPFWLLSIVSLMPGRQRLRRVGLPIMRYFTQVTELGDPAEANALLGAPETTLEAWCALRAPTVS